MDACLINISVARRNRASASGVLRIAGRNVVSQSGHFNIDKKIDHYVWAEILVPDPELYLTMLDQGRQGGIHCPG